MVVEAAFQIHDSAANVQDAVSAEAETTSATIDNSQFGGKDSFDNSFTPKRKNLFTYCEASQVLPKKCVLILWMKSMKKLCYI
ncbi:unnamed protein product [Rotaria sp. Silwood2]|nr:unnamed protein product [Rotaria sp. Silwood2]CAF2818927.1 unnamed protein product [Rotaria sp. Silwood2]CAF3256719.1 unnamed protein product [Rotaria sp. Silwood2]CAF3350819.1 unnamed protein product [Rotaria sp. Silwood2]CAF4113651.1 unnamed protein product [Rotaria sp. Silwood2]